MKALGKKAKLGMIVLCLVTCSCEHWILPPDPPNHPREIFEQLWEDIHYRYAFFDHKKIDWMEIREVYSTQIVPDLDDKKLFEIMGNMLFAQMMRVLPNAVLTHIAAIRSEVIVFQVFLFF